MSESNETLDAAKPEYGPTAMKLACGNSVSFVQQVAKQMGKFSSRYVPCNDGSNFCRMFGKLPFNAEFNAIFHFHTTIDPGFYIPRTHGHWWGESPLGSKEDFMPQNNDLSVGHDFVDFIFETEVYPLRICVFEAFTPGCIIRIWAERFDTKLWHELWSGPVENCSGTHRIFFPSIKTCSFKTKLLRFELSHSHTDYYTQIEGAFLMGTTHLIVPLDTCQNPNLDTLYLNIERSKNFVELEQNRRLSKEVLDDDLSKLKKMIATNWVLHKSSNNGKVSNVKLLSVTPIEESSSESVSRDDTSNVFDIFPDEAVLKILSQLDLISLCRCSQVNRRFNSLARDALLYTSLNLKPYWNILGTKALQYLMPRCKFLRRLDMSWCGNYDDSLIKPIYMIEFLDACGKLLTNLRLDCCQFVNDLVMMKIASCSELKELCLNNCREISDSGFQNIAHLRLLERLELFRARIETTTLCTIIHRNSQMRHLNLAEPSKLQMDQVARQIAVSCPYLESIDCWYSQTLTFDGLSTFSRCTNLREINFGWCSEILYLNDRWNDAMRSLLSCCSSLEKIDLTAQPFFTDEDFEPLFSNQKLRQLHLGGAGNVTPLFFAKLLSSCPKIRMIDLNCSNVISKAQVLTLRKMYPEVCIKYGYGMSLFETAGYNN